MDRALPDDEFASNPALHTLQHVFGYSDFRPPQDAIIDTVLGGDNALVIMPTGGGKSLCYQIPALLREGCAIVVSPLIALMQDQVDALKQLGVRAAYLNSTLAPEEAQAVEQTRTRPSSMAPSQSSSVLSQVSGRGSQRGTRPVAGCG